MRKSKQKLIAVTGPLEAADVVCGICLDEPGFSVGNTSEYLSGGVLRGVVRFPQENPYRRLLEMTRQYCPSGASDALKDETKLSEQEYTDFLEKYISEMSVLETECREKQKIADDCAFSIEQLRHFVDSDIALGELYRCKYAAVRFGRLPEDSLNMLSVYKNNPNVLFVPVSRDGEYCWGVYVAPKKAEDEVDRIFAGLFFERLRLPEADSTSKTAMQVFEERRKAAENELADIKKRIDDYKAKNAQMLLSAQKVFLRLCDIFEIKKNAVRHAGDFILIGTIPNDYAEAAKQRTETVSGVRTTVYSGILGAKTLGKIPG